MKVKVQNTLLERVIHAKHTISFTSQPNTQINAPDGQDDDSASSTHDFAEEIRRRYEDELREAAFGNSGMDEDQIVEEDDDSDYEGEESLHSSQDSEDEDEEDDDDDDDDGDDDDDDDKEDAEEKG